MSNRHCFPPEILDYTIDALHHEPGALRKCCLVAKSWVPRTRKHLFSHVIFTTRQVLESWKTTFPDPSRSSAHHTRTLTIFCPDAATAADAAEGGWIPSFSRILSIHLIGFPISPTPFHKFSPTLKSLRLEGSVLSSPQVFKLVCSYPLLENLVIVCRGLDEDHDPHTPEVVVPSTSPAFTGTLGVVVGMGAPRWLLSLPNGLRFRKLGLTWRHEEDLQWVREVAIACCDTLESLDVTSVPPGTFALSCTRPVTELHLY
jgi:hypothetical protein